MLSTEQLQKMIRGDMNSVSSLHESQPDSLIMAFDDSGKCFQDFNVQIVSRHISDLLLRKLQKYSMENLDQSS
jgi:hypothetical protein